MRGSFPGVMYQPFLEGRTPLPTCGSRRISIDPRPPGTPTPLLCSGEDRATYYDGETCGRGSNGVGAPRLSPLARDELCTGSRPASSRGRRSLTGRGPGGLPRDRVVDYVCVHAALSIWKPTCLPRHIGHVLGRQLLSSPTAFVGQNLSSVCLSLLSNSALRCGVYRGPRTAATPGPVHGVVTRSHGLASGEEQGSKTTPPRGVRAG